MPEMIFGDSCLVLKHVKKWLPPVEVPAAALWKFRCTKKLRVDGVLMR
ncbi:hypothetical protein RchiOBHm_Chr6g0257511 [Rosa chinensis]|uniref:Uncharacterized protein n=1 Tax=Rosa chinensis TaxID=74649 RepID=A0A2P6PMG4_ROSCH|nr:hypothetical protein RchiOBHm_Chr6g0257511 [Rosa chinensis]